MEVLSTLFSFHLKNESDDSNILYQKVTEMVFQLYLHIRSDLVPEGNRSEGRKKEILINPYALSAFRNRQCPLLLAVSAQLLPASVSPFLPQWAPPHICISQLCLESIPRFAFVFSLSLRNASYCSKWHYLNSSRIKVTLRWWKNEASMMLLGLGDEYLHPNTSKDRNHMDSSQMGALPAPNLYSL